MNQPQPESEPLLSRAKSAVRTVSARIGTGLGDMSQFLARGARHLTGDVAAPQPLGVCYALVFGCICAWLLLVGANLLLCGALPRALKPAGPAAEAPIASAWQREGERVEIVVEDLAADPAVVPADQETPWRRYHVRKLVDTGKGKEARVQDIVTVESALRQTPAGLAVVLHLRTSHGMSIEWWKTKGLAESNAIIEVSPLPMQMRQVRFPTSPTALTTWLRTYFRDQRVRLSLAITEELVDKQQLDVAIAGELERELSRDLGHASTALPVVLLRLINGWIQLALLAAFNAILLHLAARQVVWNDVNNIDKDKLPLMKKLDDDEQTALLDNYWPSVRTSGPAKEVYLADAAARQFYDNWKIHSFVLTIWKKSLLAASRPQGAIADRVRDIAQVEKEQIENSGWFARTIASSLPALGFLGTVWGISAALGGTGAVLSDELAKQQSGVSVVALHLAFAFDTTLIALVLSLLVAFLYAASDARIQRGILETQEFCLTRLQGERRGTRKRSGESPASASAGSDLVTEPETDTYGESLGDAERPLAVDAAVQPTAEEPESESPAGLGVTVPRTVEPAGLPQGQTAPSRGLEDDSASYEAAASPERERGLVVAVVACGLLLWGLLRFF